MSNVSPSALSVTGSVSAFDVAERRVVAHLVERIVPAPMMIFDDQDVECFAKGLNLYSGFLINDKSTVYFPDQKLILFTIENARFVISNNLDGMIIDRENRSVVEPSCFCVHDLYAPHQALPNMPIIELDDEVFIGFDAALRNYYHWILYGVSKSCVARDILPPDVKIIVPDVDDSLPHRHPVYSRETFEHSIALAGLKDRVTALKDGVYKARKVHFFWHEPTMPELYLNFDEPYRAFDALFQVPERPELPKRFYVTREGGGDSRITPEEQAQIDQVLERHGYEKIYLERLDLETQIALFRQAEGIIAPHGAGLANLVFARPGTKVIELNRPLDGQEHLRNCFYIIAQKRQLTYVSFNLAREVLIPEMLGDAIMR